MYYEQLHHFGAIWSPFSDRVPDEYQQTWEDGLLETTPLTQFVEETFRYRSDCPCCRFALESSSMTPEEAGYEYDAGFMEIRSCPRCAYWQIYNLEFNREVIGNAVVSTLRDFDSRLPHECYDELAQHLRRQPRLWHRLSPEEMEKLVAAILKANYRDAEVLHVGKPGDRGVDVLFIDGDDKQWLVQVKRRQSANACEGFETLQKLLGTMFLEDGKLGMIATTADHFSHQVAKHTARLAGRGICVELLDRGILNRMLGPLLPVRPWRDFVRTHLARFELGGPETERKFVRQLSDPRQLWLF